MRSLIPILALAPLLSACGEETQARMESAAEDLKTRTADGVGQAKEAISKAIAEFEQSSDETLSKIDDRIAVYRVKAKEAGASAQAEMNKALADLEGKRKALAEHKTGLASAPPEKAGEKLQELKASLAAAKQAIDDAARYFKQPD
ncbi:MAG: hypothetical protein ACKVXR_01305 [Planctomycetota bacterium]